MSKPPKIVIPGLNRGIGVPPGYVVGRMPGTGKGPAQLLNLASLRKLGVAGAAGVAQSTSTAVSIAHSETVSLKTSVSASLSQISSSLSGAVSSTTSLSTAVSTVISGSISAANSRIDSLSTAVGGGGGVDDDSALSTSLSSAVSINTIQSTSLSQISSSLSGAISSTSSLSSAVSTVDSNQSTSLSQISSSLSAEISTDLSRINSLSTAVGGGGASSYTLITEFVADGTSGTCTFSSIVGTYKSLRLDWVARGAAAAASVNYQLTINGDGGADYDVEILQGASTTASALNATGATSAVFCSIPGSTAPSGEPCVGSLVIPGYADTVFNKILVGMYGYKTANAAASIISRQFAVWWRSTAAITAISIVLSSGNFVTGSKLRLYGET